MKIYRKIYNKSCIAQNINFNFISEIDSFSHNS